MPTIPGYHINQQIYESDNTLIYRAHRESDTCPVILKLLKETSPSPERIAWLKREYTILRGLDIPGVIKAYSLEQEQHYWMIVLEDIGGTSLRHLNLAGTLTIETFLNLAATISTTLGHIHRHNVIHKDINPANIIYNPERDEIKIIDFGIATIQSHEMLDMTGTGNMEGTLAYMSPEQTGRMNRSIDYRTDFYSLGVLFYELLTGQLPFLADDVMEMVHSHIARMPTPPHDIRPDIPPILSSIILKLLAKNAEDRYQSAHGLVADLHHCLEQLGSHGNIDFFPLGRHDIADRLHIPQKLYGRDAEIETLLAAFERVSMGDKELLLVSGPSGVGKTVLVQELYKPVTSQHGIFASGKFDQFQRSAPYLAIIQACQSLVRQLLSQSQARITRWQQQLLDAIGRNGQVIIDLIPDVELIIGPQPPVPVAGPAEAQHRFNLVFQQFIKAFTQPQHPLVIFLDDLQWADDSSIKLIELLMTTPDLHDLFLIGAFRNDDPDGPNPLGLIQEIMRQSPTRAQHLALEPLDTPIVTRLLSETLHTTAARARPLAERVVEKTHGNPFFINEFLKQRYLDQAIWFDYEQHQWQWDLAQIRAQDMTDNVATLMSSRIQRIDPHTQKMLKLAACIGGRFDLEMLAMISEETTEEVEHDLAPAIEQGIIIPDGQSHRALSGNTTAPTSSKRTTERVYNAHYKFAHNRIQQAVHALVSDEDREAVHWHVGRILLFTTPEAEREEKIFDIVNQLNQGRSFIIDDDERDELAELNLQAGQRAMAAAAYEPATEYLRVAVDLLSETGWETSYALTFTVYREYARCRYLGGYKKEAEHIFIAILSRATSALDKAEVANARMILYSSDGRLDDVIAAGIEGLALLGIPVSLAPTPSEIMHERAILYEAMRDRAIPDLAHLPHATEPEPRMMMRLLMDMLVAVWWTANKPLLHYATLKMITLSLHHGNTDASTFGYLWYGMLLGSEQGDYQRGYEAGQLALQLNDTFGKIQHIPKVSCIYGVFVAPWRSHIANCLPYLQQGFEVGNDVGDLFWTGVNAYTIIYSRLIKGDELDDIMHESKRYFAFAQRTGQAIPLNMIIFSQQFILSLKGQTSTPWSLSDTRYQEEQHIKDIQESGVLRPLYWYYKIKLQLLYRHGQYQEALAVAVESDRLIVAGASAGVVTLPEHYLYYALTLAALYPTAPPDQRTEYWKTLLRNQEQLQTWANHAPDNFHHKYLLVAAEMARLKGNDDTAISHYQEAIQSAREHGYRQNEALAHELVARFYIERGDESDAVPHLIEARNGYLRWGARALVNALDKHYSHLFAEARHSGSAPSMHTSTTRSTTMTTSGTASNALDLATVLKASQALSGEMKLESLLSQMMHIIIENAGAQRGVLMLEKDAQWVIEAECIIEQDEHEHVTVLQSAPVAEATLPMSVINYAIRTRQNVVLNHATQEGQFTQDSYITTARPRSILCAPLINRGELRGILYLENNLTTGAFTTERVEILNLLMAQAAISLENAMLYRTMEQKVRDRTEELSNANKEIVTLYERLRAENLRLEAEVDVTHKLQQMLLPRPEELEQVEGLDIAGFMEPASQVGGDYYDVLQHKGRVKIGIGDVTGHGLESGVLMLMVQTAVRTLLTSEETDTTHFFTVLNQTIYDNIQRMQSDKNLTLALVDYDHTRGELRLSGQHEHVIVVRQNGQTSLVDTLDLGFPIGLDADISPFVAEMALKLQPGDGVVLYTDGITEAENEQGEFYGLDRLAALVAQHWAAPAATIVATVIADVRHHIGAHQVYDDITLVVMKQQEGNESKENNTMSHNRIFGDFIEGGDDSEFLIINFSPSSLTLKQRWRNSGLSADFLGDYWSVFFPNDETTPNRREEVKSAVSYIANELLENAMKFSHDSSVYPISIGLHLYENELRFYVANSVNPDTLDTFQAFLQTLLTEDPDELYIAQLEQSAEEDSGTSHLGLLTMINDYQARLAWKFETVPNDAGDQVIRLTTMVQLPMEQQERSE